MYTWGDVYSRMDHRNDIDREMQAIHLAEQATREERKSSRRVRANLAPAAAAFVIAAHWVAGVVRYGEAAFTHR